MIYDGHAYCFPTPQNIGGFEDRTEFWRHLQLFMAQARQQPTWRSSDGGLADSKGLYDPSQPWSFDGLKNVNFRTRDHGLVEWKIGSEYYVKQALPPFIQDFSFSAENLIAEMDYAGIDKALLHRTPYMGLDDKFIADCCRRYPKRIRGLVQVPEWWLPSRLDEAISKLDYGINICGLAGLQFAPFHRHLYNLSSQWTSTDFDPFWTFAAELEIPIFFTLGAVGSLDEYLEECRILRCWLDRFPDIQVIMTHGFPWRMFAHDNSFDIPESVYSAMPIDNPNFHIQILFAVFMQSEWDYPMAQVQPVLEKMVEHFGAHRILWGSDIPIVLLHWTYRQSLDYIRNYCPFLQEAEMDNILGENMEKLIG
tara:strand:- start:18150 stop:19247 length:1098 start_codon:yes stop_codon:yes gene_type:complete